MGEGAHSHCHRQQEAASGLATESVDGDAEGWA